jgi:hypothetical protein
MVSINAGEAGDGKPFNGAGDNRRFSGSGMNAVAAYPIGKDTVVWGGRNGREWAAGVEVKW